MTRLHQPNLTCSFDITMTDDYNLWTLVMKNHEDIGITDDQFVTSLWTFCNVYTNSLVEQKIFSLEKDEEIPEAASIVTHDKRYKTWNIIVNGFEPLTQSTFMILLAETCKTLAKAGGIELEGSTKQSPREL